ncbi:MAG: hypothetical protein K2G96_04900 [Clostridia bacterium]|nr:hypothetical protein [Clostridia bacterium]
MIIPNSQYFSCSFNIKIKKLGKYKVEYTLYGDYLNDNNYKWRKNFSSQITSEVTDSYKVSEYSYASTDTKTRTIIIKDIKITEVKDEALYTDIALALGVSAAVLTATAVTLFILEKKGIIKSKKHSSE